MTARAQPRVVAAVLGPTASGKSALGVALAERIGGEIVGCDSTAVYRGFDIGTDKVPLCEQRGIPHHCVDIVEPDRDYTAADYARDAMAAIQAVHARGRLPVIVGGTGFYYRALVRGLFPGPGRDDRLRGRLEALAARRGPERLHRLLARIDPPSAARIRPRDEMRVVRALEVYYQSGRTLTEHFADTRAPLAGWTVVAIALRPPWEEIARRVAERVDRQFARGIEDEVRAILARGVPPSARPFTGYVYRTGLELVRGVRDAASAREVIVRENCRYARRQLIWFRKEPNLVWIHRAGDRAEALGEAEPLVAAQMVARQAPGPPGEHPTNVP
ncbi:MAG TPA: tRNA (adenosine(37)-N6)-dimethylallyltransferase MiaA [Vicinamibacterales bacterium]|nr:tRNA (adenosine(37)-N6)-dimethylallyltransferase MiaA [Vicinamibacterales bacterium]